MPFDFGKTAFDGLLIVRATRFDDERGWFMETFKKGAFASAGLPTDFVQENHSISCRGALRGLHFQKPPHAQGKLVRVLRGSVWDVAVDLRPSSHTYLRWYGLELSAGDGLMLYIPPGFAHGFLALEDESEFYYKCTAEYDRASEAGYRWNDPTFSITWPLEDVMLSAKDAALPFFERAP